MDVAQYGRGLKDKMTTDSTVLNPVTLVDGCFDPLHEGHIEYFSEARNLGFPVLCAIQTDDYIRSVKRRKAILSQDQRLRVISSVRYIDSAMITEGSTLNVIQKIKPAIYFKGKDWEMKGLPKEEVDFCKVIGIKILFGARTLNSSTIIYNKVKHDLKTDIP